MNHRDDQPIQTLRISDRDKAKLLWAIEESSRRTVESTQRRLRVTCTNTDAILTIIGDSGSKTRLAVLARDLSRWGASVIHGRYMYPNARCELEIKALDGTWHTRAGEIRHIRHVQGMIHNLGIRFDDAIDLSEFVVLSPDEETRHLQELADDMPDDIDGQLTRVANRVLIVDDFASDRKLFSFWLTRAGMEVSTVSDCAGARDRIEEERFDLLVIDGRLGDESGPELISKLRNSQFVSPILAVSADDDGNAQTNAISAGANIFLSKPFTAEQLVETAFKLMGLDTDAATEPIFSQFNDDQEMRPLLTAFTRSLGQYIEQLHTANSTNDYEAIDEVSRTLKGAGSGYGLSEITDHASDVLGALNDNAADMGKIREMVNELIGVLNRVKLR